VKKENWRLLFLGLALLVIGAFLFLVRNILAPFLVAFVLAYLLIPLVDGLERRGLGRKVAIAAVFLGILLAMSLTVFLLLPVLYQELDELAVVLPKVMEDLGRFIEEMRSEFKETGLPHQVAEVVDENLLQLEAYLVQRLGELLGNLPAMLASLSILILSPILAIYFLADWPRLRQGFFRLVPQHWRMEWQRLWLDINHVLRRFLRGNLLVAAIVGVLIGLGVQLIGMDYALLIGLICGVFDFPYFGPLIGAVPAILLGLTKSPTMALEVALIILVVQQLEGNVITPKLVGDSVGLHPLMIVFALLAGAEIAGFWGMLLAVPLAAILRVIIRYVYLRLVSPHV